LKAATHAEVVFTVRGDDNSGKRRVRRVGAEFIGRLLLRVLPPGIKRIRGDRVMASAWPVCQGRGVVGALIVKVRASNPMFRKSISCH
jgi:hypothetical protein